MISIIIPFKNRLGLLKDTLNSILNQTSTEYQCILVNDNCSENTDWFYKFCEENSHFTLIDNNRTPGAPGARNSGAKHALADDIMFLDSDDLLKPKAVQNRLEVLKRYPNNDFIAFRTETKQSSIIKTFGFWSTDHPFKMFLNSKLPFTIMGPVWKKNSFISLGMFNEEFPNCQDHELHLRATYHSENFLLVNKSDNYYIQHNQGGIYSGSKPGKVLIGLKMLIESLSNYDFQPSDSIGLLLLKLHLHFKEGASTKTIRETYHQICELRKKPHLKVFNYLPSRVFQSIYYRGLKNQLEIQHPNSNSDVLSFNGFKFI